MRMKNALIMMVLLSLAAAPSSAQQGCQVSSSEMSCCSGTVRITVIPCTQCPGGGECCFQEQPGTTQTNFVYTCLGCPGWTGPPTYSGTLENCLYRLGRCGGEFEPRCVYDGQLRRAICTNEYYQGEMTCFPE